MNIGENAILTRNIYAFTLILFVCIFNELVNRYVTDRALKLISFYYFSVNSLIQFNINHSYMPFKRSEVIQ